MGFAAEKHNESMASMISNLQITSSRAAATIPSTIASEVQPRSTVQNLCLLRREIEWKDLAVLIPIVCSSVLMMRETVRVGQMLTSKPFYIRFFLGSLCRSDLAAFGTLGALLGHLGAIVRLFGCVWLQLGALGGILGTIPAAKHFVKGRFANTISLLYLCFGVLNGRST